jgi:hypothetical protein
LTETIILNFLLACQLFSLFARHLKIASSIARHILPLGCPCGRAKHCEKRPWRMFLAEMRAAFPTIIAQAA